MTLKDALTKKGGLTLAALASYDDVITDAVIDRVGQISLAAYSHSSSSPVVLIFLA
jgi:hypothetical protein